jgi:hypothetical protein
MNRQEQIAKEMAALRLSGAASAERLPAAWNRAKDWREYVRAFPLQSVAAAAVVGFALIPKRKTEYVEQPQRNENGYENRRNGSVISARSNKGVLGSLVAPMLPWATAFATQAIHRMLANQFNALSTRIFTDERQADNQGQRASGFEHAGDSSRKNSSSNRGRNSQYNGHQRSDQ